MAEFPPAQTPASNPRQKAALISLGLGSLLLAAKFVAWLMTDSSTVLSDAMESIVNVVAAFAMFFAVRFSSQPADDDHPYGHGKIEFVTSGSEGGAIAIAALLIIVESVRALVSGAVPHSIEIGVWIVGLAGLANCGLGLYLIRVGKREGSAALIGDGHHVLSDFWTSAGAVVGLILVIVTKLTWIDPVVAILVSFKLLVTGWGLLRSAARGLLDEADPEVVAHIAAALEKARGPGVIEIHDLRAINVGGMRHVDLHVVVPEFWAVERAHREMDEYAARTQANHERPADLQFHVDPCERAYCRSCDYADCAVRREPCAGLRPFTAESVARGPSPAEPTPAHPGGRVLPAAG